MGLTGTSNNTDCESFSSPEFGQYSSQTGVGPDIRKCSLDIVHSESLCKLLYNQPTKRMAYPSSSHSSGSNWHIPQVLPCWTAKACCS